MQNKENSTELYYHLVEGLLENKEQKLREILKNTQKHLEKYYTDVKLVVVNTKRPTGIKKLIMMIIQELRKTNIKYMEAIQSGKYIWIAYRIEKKN